MPEGVTQISFYFLSLMMVANTLVYNTIWMTVDDSTPQTKAKIIFYCMMKAVVDMQNIIFNFMPSFILMLIYLSLSIVIVAIII